ncbi:aldo/keto reductase [Echinimonas agarilytica]|uniref:Aldo/keto reductase n=1 Tax=Echinimonas agarilytica TaxID=1215918 RepID=A0AA41W7W3_9GAMM|nr:aldo/keto reductase [Echinimonas agarilytica]MCM2680248.1 aldo/keto reductase [Echinimonas agarilytica]
MKTIALAKYLPGVSRLSYGCMGLGGPHWEGTDYSVDDISQAHQVIDTLLDLGINHLDHADIYRSGKSEAVIGEVFKQRPELREQFFIQSKCGIRFADEAGPHRYDQSKDWILQSVDGILQRLDIEYLDTLLIHRPDPLMEQEDVVEAITTLTDNGKVRHFGVSNMHVGQIKFLQSHLQDPLVVNQLEMSLSQLGWLNEGVFVANPEGANVNFAPGTLEYCRNREIQLQSWGSLSQGLFSGRGLDQQPQHIHATAERVAHYAAEYQVSREAIVLAFIMRHPALVQPVIGTVHLDRIRACAQASSIQLSREHWYDLFTVARGGQVP